MSWANRYGEVIWAGFGMWTLGGGLLIMADRSLHLGWICFYLVILGVGTGFVFQPTLVALQAHCPKAQRAVIVSNRNFMRSSGGAVGLAASSAILANVLKSSLPPRLASVAGNTFATPDLTLYSQEDRQAIEAAYAAASRAVFIWCVPLVGLCFLLCILIKDNGLVRKEEKEAVKTGSGDEEQPQEEKRAEKGVLMRVHTGEDVSMRALPARLVSPDDTPDHSRKPSVSSEKSDHTTAAEPSR